MKVLPVISAWIVPLGFLAGCGGDSAAVVDSRQSAAQAYEKAEQAFNAKNFAEAKDAYDQCLSGGLPADLLGTARVRRAVCLAEAGDFAAASEEITALESAAPNLDEVFAAKSYILAKQGKLAESKASWAQAIRYNRSVKKFGG